LPLMWCAVVALIASLGGWPSLAREYGTATAFTGTRWGSETAWLRGWTRYKSCLTVGVDASGLFVAPFVLFRLRHPPLLIPWEDVTFAPGTGGVVPVVEYHF